MFSFDQSVQFSCSVASDSLRSHGLQHTRPPCLSPTSRVYSNSCPLSRWYNPTIPSSVIPFSSHLQSFPAPAIFSNESALLIRWSKYSDWEVISNLLLYSYFLYYCHPAYLNYMQSISWETMSWKKHKLESRLLGEISITSYMQMTPPYGRKWRGTQKPLDESERGVWKSWLKAQHSEK